MNKKYKLPLRKNDVTWLYGFFSVLAESPVRTYTLAHWVVLEMFEQKIGKFTFARDTSISLKMSEVVALRDCLLHVPMNEYDDTIRNYLLTKIEQACLSLRKG